MIKYQSETIEFEVTIPLEQTLIERVVVYIYTHTSFISKHSNKTDDGYHTLTFTGGVIKGIVPQEDTKKMKGALHMDVLVEETDGSRHIDSPDTNILIEYKPISEQQ
jgi:hypothetical protein